MREMTASKWILAVMVAVSGARMASAETKVPVIYSTDLLHPYDDPDDHFDLATLLALPELDVRAIILDLGERQKERPGWIPLEQMRLVTGRCIPYARGLSAKLASPKDKGLDQPAGDQRGVELILRTLKDAEQPVTIITAGSLRDVCAAFNREPELFREKVGRLYINIGNLEEHPREWNVGLGPNAYVGIMRSGLPIYWAPCLPMNKNSSTHWTFEHREVLDNVSDWLMNYYVYALLRLPADKLDPQRAVRTWHEPYKGPIWENKRNMWCTAGFLHAAGYKVYKTDKGYVTSAGPVQGGAEARVFDFIDARVEVAADGKTDWSQKPAEPNMKMFKIGNAEEYAPAMRDCLRQLMIGFPAVYDGDRLYVHD